ncbi:MAG TPA: 30S ribosomal protein S20 [Candidatus Binatia bacterium]|nr:30S ribosomal protein S20 [Candidatus Binatia bacterium]
MPIIKSAKKRVRVARKATTRNAKVKRSLKAAVKAFHKSLTGDKKNSSTLQQKAQSELSKAGKKHIMHKNKVARKQRQLAAAAKAAGVKHTAIAKKAAPKVSKPTAKKTVTKKPATKKTTKKK